MRRPILLVTDGGFGETPVPDDALFQPGEKIVAAHESDPSTPIDVLCVAVVPVGSFIEYAIADQSIPKRPRPLTRRMRSPHTETLYILQWPNDKEPSIYTQTDLMVGQEKATA